MAAGCSPSPSGRRSPRLGFVLSQSGDMTSPRGARTLPFVPLQPGAQRAVWEPVSLPLGLWCGSCASSCCRQRRLCPPGQDARGRLLLSSGNTSPNLLRLHKPRPLPWDLQGQAQKLETAQGGCCRSPPAPLPRSPHLVGAAGQRYAGAVRAMRLLLCSWQLSSPLGSELKNNILRQRLAASSLHVPGAGSLPPARSSTCPDPPRAHTPRAPGSLWAAEGFFLLQNARQRLPATSGAAPSEGPARICFPCWLSGGGISKRAAAPVQSPPLVTPSECLGSPSPSPPLPLVLFRVASCLGAVNKASFSLPFLETSAVLPRKLPPQKGTSRARPRRKRGSGSWKQPREGLGELLRLFLGGVSPPARLPSPPTARRVVLPLPLAAPIPGSCAGAAAAADFPGGCRGCRQPGEDGEQGGEQSRGCSDPASPPAAAGTACASEAGRREEQRTDSAGCGTNNSGWNLQGCGSGRESSD